MRACKALKVKAPSQRVAEVQAKLDGSRTVMKTKKTNDGYALCSVHVHNTLT